ncbi:MAG: HD domain-containing protein [Bacteroidota bacterium]|nr:HD domain-containing protein [Bacteroidota bacterium]
MYNYQKIEEHILNYLKNSLNENLYYHGIHHTHEVMENALEIAKAENLNEEDTLLLKIAVLYHDAGLVDSYTGHEEAGCVKVKAFLPEFQVSDKDIEIICGMIRATKIPQTPHNILEKILADADLKYLGTNKFEDIGNTLFKELKIYANIISENQWFEIQKSFLEKHHFHTDYCIKKYEGAKQENLKKVIEHLASLG